MYNLVLLHGWGTDKNIWINIIPKLSSHFYVTTLDLTPWDPNLENMALQVLAQTPKNAIYLGWSLGGLLAWQIAIQASERVQKLITVATTPKFLATKNWEAMPEKTFHNFYKMFEKDHMQALKYFTSLQFMGEPQAKELTTTAKANLNKQQVNKQFLQNGLKLLRDTDLRNEINKIRCPAVHIYGENDHIVPVATAQQLPAKTKIVKNSGHALFLSHQEEFLRLLNKFINV